MKRMSANQAKAQAARQARAAVRFAIVRRVAGEHGSKQEAAHRAGLTAAGLASLLYTRTGSTAWPPTLKGAP